MTTQKLLPDTVIEILRKPFPEEAFSAIENKPYLTTLKAVYIVERLNEAFNFGRWNVEHEVIDSPVPNFVLVKGHLLLLDYPDLVFPITYGGHLIQDKSADPADAHKSAVTDLTSKLSSFLEIGIDVFKGKITSNGKKKGSSGSGRPAQGQNGNGGANTGTIDREDFPTFGKHKQGGEDPKKWSEVPKGYLEWLSTADKTRDDVKEFVLKELVVRTKQEKKQSEPTPQGTPIDKQIADFEKILTEAEAKFRSASKLATFSSFLMNFFKTTDLAKIAIEFVGSANEIHTDLINLYKEEVKPEVKPDHV